jgi:hypothetical protein
MPVKILIEKTENFITFYTADDIKTKAEIRNIYDVRIDLPVVIKSYTHTDTKNFIKICTNDTDPDYPGGSVIKIKPEETAILKENGDIIPFNKEDILVLRRILLDYFKK